MSERNYAQDNFVTAIANTPWPSGFDGVIGEAAFKQQLYFAMVSGAVWVKSDIEARRAQNSWGCITWQFGEIVRGAFVSPPPCLRTHQTVSHTCICTPSLALLAVAYRGLG